jgi:response regulator RpfG family c-di-GMP phosphodiesterase
MMNRGAPSQPEPQSERPVVLVVDDDVLVLTITRRLLMRSGFAVRTLEDARAAVCEVLAEPPFAVVADLHMPELDGAALLGLVRGLYPSVVRVLHTGEETNERIAQSERAGEFALVQKSGHGCALSDVLEAARARGCSLPPAAHAPSRLLAAQLSDALMPRLEKARGHGTLLAERARLLGGLVGLPQAACDALALAAQLHDVAMAALPERLRVSKDSYDAAAWSEVQRHPLLAASWLRRCRALAAPDQLEAALTIVHQHHERYDGTGYPNGLAGEAIGLPARVLSVLDTYSAMRRPRRHRAVRDATEAAAELGRVAGSQLDPDLVRVFLRNRELY